MGACRVSEDGSGGWNRQDFNRDGVLGYDDRVTGRPAPRPVTDRWGGETYRALWQEAIAAAPEYVLITSWNEWHEGSEIEASVEYGSRLLDDTAIYSREFLTRNKQ